MATKTRTDRNVVTLADLAPRRDVKGGSQRVFGASSSPFASDVAEHRRDAMKPKIAKDLPPKSPTKVKGGGWMNDNITLVRGAKPAK